MLVPFKEWFKSHFEETLNDFFTLLRFQSVSTDLAYQKEIYACARYLKDFLEKMGFQARLWETPGHPIVFASNENFSKELPTLLIYLHYDVQPVAPINEWDSDPFEPIIKNGKVVARGAVDNKGQCFYTLLALKALYQILGKFPLNIKVCIEGEEEIGSPGLEKVLKEKEKEFCADYCLIVDVEMLGPNQPAITLGTRGIVTLNLECQNGTIDLHSGSFGGFVMNPLRALTQVLSACWDDQGKVRIPDFYQDVFTPSKEELDLFNFDVDPKKEASLLGVKAFSGEEGFSLLESNWIRPCLEINGLGGGYLGEGVKTIIPAKASVKLSCRLVPFQDPSKIAASIASFLRKKMPKNMEISLKIGHGSKGFMTSPSSQLARACRKAFEDVFKTSCSSILSGATIPIGFSLKKVSGAELVLIGVGLPGDKMHAPNESFGLDRLEMGFLSIVRVIDILSKGDF